jgi:hypothetical protein
MAFGNAWTDVRLWVLLLALLRLIGITDPPLETSHHWRQTTVTMVARNFHEGGIDILHPRVDMAGERTGITGMEVPLLAAGIAALSDLFGYTHWYGRLIALVLCSAGLLAFHRLVRTYLDAGTALHATVILGVSLWFSYGRKIMPDVPSMAFILIGLACAADALHGRRTGLNGLLAAVALALGTAMKLPSGYLLVLVPVMAFHATTRYRERMVLLGLVALFQLPVLYWYFVRVPHLEVLGGYTHFFMGTGLAHGLRELLAMPLRVLDNFYFDALRFSGAALALAGLVMAVVRRQRPLLVVTALTSAAFGMIMLKAGQQFWKHAYYVVPFVPVMALLAGRALAQVRSVPWRVALLTVVVAEGLASQWQDFRISPTQAPLLELEATLDTLGQRDELIVVNSGAIPTPIYFAHRKGWTAYGTDLARPFYCDSLAALGAQWLVIVHTGYEGAMRCDLPVVVNNAHFTVHRMAR